MDIQLNHKACPVQDGKYYAGNFNHMKNRLEIASVEVVGQDVFIADDPSPFIYTDFDFWSAKVEK